MRQAVSCRRCEEGRCSSPGRPLEGKGRFGAGKQRTISTSGEGAIVRIRISIIRDFADWVQASRIAAATSSGSNISE